MGAGLALLLATGLAAGDGQVLQLSIGTEGRVRHYEPSGAPAQRLGDVTLVPDARVDLDGPDLHFTARYGPRFMWLKPLAGTPGDGRLDVLHAGELRFDVVAARPWTVLAVLRATVGRTDLLTQNRLSTTPPPVVSSAATLRYLNVAGDLTFASARGRRTFGTLTVGGFQEGGSDRASRVTLPTQRGMHAEGEWNWGATPRARIGVLADGFWAQYPDLHGNSGDANALLIWRYTVSRTLEARAGAGGAAAYTDQPPHPWRKGLYPSGLLGLAHQAADGTSTAALEARTGAAVDRISGGEMRFVEAGANASWRIAQTLSLRARALGTYTQLDTADSRRATALLGGEWAAGRRMRFQLSFYGEWQRTMGRELPSFFEVGSTLGVFVDAPKVF